MPKTAKRTTINACRRTSRTTIAPGSEPQRIGELPDQIRHLSDVLDKVQTAANELEDNDPSENVLASTVDQLWRRFEKFEQVVYSTPVRPGDIGALRARAEIARHRMRYEFDDLKKADHSIEQASAHLLGGVRAFCEEK